MSTKAEKQTKKAPKEEKPADAAPVADAPAVAKKVEKKVAKKVKLVKLKFNIDLSVPESEGVIKPADCK